VGLNGLVVFEKPRLLALYGATRRVEIYETDEYDKTIEFYRQTGGPI